MGKRPGSRIVDPIVTPMNPIPSPIGLDSSPTANDTVIKDGHLIIQNHAGGERLRISVQGITVKKADGTHVFSFEPSRTTLAMGGGSEGNLTIYPKNTPINSPYDEAFFHAEGAQGVLFLGGKKVDGKLVLRRKSDAKQMLLLDGANGDIRVGTDSKIHLDGSSGDIILKNADFAEDFDVLESISLEVEPGSIMVLNEDGKLVESTQAYDSKVAGVVSGAGEYRPGLIMDKKHEIPHRLPIALSGKVMCKVDADFGPIEVGDLITSSSCKGHGMKASDSSQAFGAVIGKALKPLSKGKGLIPILVALQ